MRNQPRLMQLDRVVGGRGDGRFVALSIRLLVPSLNQMQRQRDYCPSSRVMKYCARISCMPRMPPLNLLQNPDLVDALQVALHLQLLNPRRAGLAARPLDHQERAAAPA